MAHFKLALIGNPNSGKTTLFNRLTGMKQKVANFPGVTVEKKTGKLNLTDAADIEIIDFPGTYSLYPTSKDEKILLRIICDIDNADYPDGIIFVADATQLERHLLLFTQIRDLGLPTLLVLNMSDVVKKEGIELNIATLSERLNAKIIAISARNDENIEALQAEILKLTATSSQDMLQNSGIFYALSEPERGVVGKISELLPRLHTYTAILVAHHYAWLPHLSQEIKLKIKQICDEFQFIDLKAQLHEIMQRFDRLAPIVQSVRHDKFQSIYGKSEQADQVLTNKYLGPILFLAILFVIFQSIFAFAQLPMDLIEQIFGWTQGFLRTQLPEGWLTDLLCDGLLAGLGGIIVFVPQIAILFFLIALLEDVGYMARAVFMFDGIMQKFGMNGRSIVSLVSGGACAIPAIMSARTISNHKERLITILVTPLISCSARIPVYALLVAFVVPREWTFLIFNAQGLVFTGLYLLGISSALVAGWVFKKILKTDEKSSLMIELPPYRMPSPINILQTVVEKVKSFVLGAGKVIIIISIVLWFLSNFGLPSSMRQADEKIAQMTANQTITDIEKEDKSAAIRLEYSFAGQIGKIIEPTIRPLGFDWKIGIALLTSFAAREVFVGTMATIYSVGSAADDDFSIREQMKKERNLITGDIVYTPATAMSLLVFYVFALQCMSTLAVVKRETRTWKWAMLQFFFMGALAYFGAWLTYILMK